MNEFLRQPCSFVQKRSWTVDIVAFFASICSRRLVSFRSPSPLLWVWLTTVVTGVWREAEHHTTGSANWRKIKWKKAEGGGDRHQKERKRVQGDAGTDLVCSCDPCLLEWRVFLASSRCCYMAGRPFPPSRLCFVPRQGQTPFLLRDAWIYCDRASLPSTQHRQDLQAWTPGDL